MNPTTFKQDVAEGKRRTLPFTDAAIDNLKRLVDHFSDESFKISQFEMINVVLERADASDIKISSTVAQIKKAESASKEKEEMIRKRVAALSPEDLEKALALLGK